MRHGFLSLAAGGLALLWTAGQVAGQGAGGAAGAEPERATAYSAVRLVGKTLGRDAMERVAEVSGRDGSPQPSAWTVVLKEGAGSREVEVAGGKIAAQRPLTRPAAGGVIRLADLNLDSSGAFDATEAQARKVHLRFDSLNYDLRVNEETGKPVWRVELLDREGAGVGTMRLAAHDGSTLGVSGRLASNPPRTEKAVPAPTPTTRLAEQGATPYPYRPAAPPPPVRTHTEHTATSVVTTTTTTTNRPPLPPEDDNDHPEPVATVETGEPAVHDTEEGGLFTRAGRTIDHTNHRVEHSIRKAGASVQRFFTGHSDMDREE